MELNIPRARDGKFKPSVLPERKRMTFMLDDIVRAMFLAGIPSRKNRRGNKELNMCSCFRFICKLFFYFRYI